jgi:hypothetical protein
MCDEIDEGIGRIIAGVRASLRRIEQGQTEIIDALGELKKRSQVATTKESYSPSEAATLLDKRPYTVREWCRLGRIRAKKRPCGRGVAPEWEILQEEIERIKSHGLLPMPKRH